MDVLIHGGYLLSALLFILGIKRLSHPRTAKQGNGFGALAMLIAVVVTLFDRGILGYELIVGGIVTGTALGALLAYRVQMTQMPQLVAAFNGLGGAASVLVAGAQVFLRPDMEPMVAVACAIATLIGAVTATGSLVALLKLQGSWVPSGAMTAGWLKALNVLMLMGALGATVWLSLQPEVTASYGALVLVAGVLGITLVLPIGGADMPVVVALLNSYSGLAACGTGFALGNILLVIAGALVGASGLILTQIMCKAMNRSLMNVLTGGIGAQGGGETSQDEDFYTGRVTSSTAEEAAMLFDVARRVVIVPGYGMAVSQAQHAVRDLTNFLEKRGVEVLFAIHPVAGRMPGHMNVLLAESDISYDKLIELDAINPIFPDTDVSLVIGANDVINPLAKEDAQSPIAGMPILDVDQSRSVIVIKRSLSPGFAGVHNPLFTLDKTLMVFGDGKQTVLEILGAMKEAA